MKSRRKQFEQYVELTLKIRSLSSPLISEIKNDTEYRDILLKNFKTIGEYAALKSKTIDDTIMPLLQSKRLLKKDEIEDLRYLNSRIFSALMMETLDVPLSYRIASRILADADKKGNEKDIIKALDSKIEIVFAYMHMTQRLLPVDESCFEYRDEGLDAAKRLLEYLPKKRFKELPDEECKHIVLINSRYISAFFDRSDKCCKKLNDQDLKMMEKSLALTYDPFYRKEAPNYNWRSHEFRTLQYITNLVDIHNERNFDKASLEKIYGYTKKLEALWHSDEDFFGKYSPEPMISHYVGRISLLTGRSTLTKYQNLLFHIVEGGKAKKFDLHENLINVFSFGEYLNSLENKKLSATDRKRLKYLYERLAQYIHIAPKKGSASFMLTFLADILKIYKEVDGGREFEDICLKIMTAIHPPTYVHTLSVAEISKILTKGLLKKAPERFIGFHGYSSSEEVLEHKDDIINFAYHSSLTHDTGKLFIPEIITTYGRHLFDEEFQRIKSHPLIGAEILSRHQGTKEYMNIAKYHHLSYDGRNGYPVDNISSLPEMPFIHIVECADCLDAATDFVGRSYKKGKTFTEVVGELKEGSGTRYAPFVVRLLDDPSISAQIQKALKEGRDSNYRKAYTILSKKSPK